MQAEMTISFIFVMVSLFGWFFFFIKGRSEEDVISIQKAYNILFIGSALAVLNMWITSNFNDYTSISCSVTAILLYILITRTAKTDKFANKFKIDYLESLIKDCENYTDEDFKRFKTSMAKEEQIVWLKTLCIKDTEESEDVTTDCEGLKTTIKTTKEVITPLIEDDEDLDDFEILLRKK